MFDDQDLGFFANFLGIFIFVLVIAYHYVIADPKYEGNWTGAVHPQISVQVMVRLSILLAQPQWKVWIDCRNSLMFSISFWGFRIFKTLFVAKMEIICWDYQCFYNVGEYYANCFQYFTLITMKKNSAPSLIMVYWIETRKGA